jgi:hypothetical protein
MMTALDVPFAPDRASVWTRLTDWLEAAVSLRYGPPAPGDEAVIDEETALQVALICAAHF